MPRPQGANAITDNRIHQLLERQAQQRPEAVALWWQGQPTTYASLNERVQEVAGRLAATGARGDRIGVLAWNCPQFLELMYAVPASGRILVPLNARLAPAELIYQLKSAGISTLFAEQELLAPLLREQALPAELGVIKLQTEYEQWLHSGPTAVLPATDADDPVWILHTSGSTGRPKGAVLTHRSFLAALRAAALGRPVQQTDRYLYPFPLFHVSAHNVLLQHQYGAAIVLTRSFDPVTTLAACRDLQVTTMSLAPTMIAMLLDHPDFRPTDLLSVRTIGYGASAMPESLLQRLLAKTSVGLCQGYGMTELSGSVAFLTVEDHALAATTKPELLQSVGKPLPTASIEIVTETGQRCATGQTGEILVKGEQCMRGYWNDADATARTIVDGWLHTGDIGRFDEEGYLYIVDRKKDMIISGGENIASREVEEVIRRHPAVKDCAVIGIPDARWGETMCAVLQLTTQISDHELSEHCKAFLANYKTPRRWARIEALPINAAGKVDKPSLRKNEAVLRQIQTYST